MKTHFSEVMVKTNNREELIDITRYVEDSVHGSKVEQGICLVYLPHSTASLVVNENEEGLIQDIFSSIQSLIPKETKWVHNRIDNNAQAHLASVILTSSRTFPIRDGTILRGRWQNIFLLELDGPRSRKIVIQILGE